MNLEALKDCRVAMVVWNTEKEDDVHVYIGKLQSAGSNYLFVNEEKGWKVLLDREQFSRLRPVLEDLKATLLQADYFFSMTIASLPEESREDFESTGMKWDN